MQNSDLVDDGNHPDDSDLVDGGNHPAPTPYENNDWPSFSIYQKSWILQVETYCNTAWKGSKYGIFAGPYFPVYGLNTGKSPYSVRMQENTVQKKLRIWTHFT